MCFALIPDFRMIAWHTPAPTKQCADGLTEHGLMRFIYYMQLNQALELPELLPTATPIEYALSIGLRTRSS